MSKISTKEQIIFAKRLGFLMRSGMPILDSLNLLKKQVSGSSGLKFYEQIIGYVSSGKNLSSALSSLPKPFGIFALNIIRVGESTGVLGENLNYLAEELKKKQQLKNKIYSALFYPAFIVLITFGLTFVLTVVVFPKILPVFSSIGLNLPFSTKILIFISSVLISHGIWIVILAIGFVLLSFYLFKKPKNKILAQRTVLKLPLLGKLFQNYFLSGFCRTLGLLLKGHMRLDEAIKITADSTENLVYKKEYIKIHEFILRGERISNYLVMHPGLFPSELSGMVSVGEASGNLSETFLYLADAYEQELDNLTKNLASLLEPVLMIFMGLLVGFVAISIITPIYSVTEKLRP